MALSIAPAPRPAPPQPAPDAGLIPTKLHSPRLRPAIVPRRRLTERIEEGLWRKLTLVSAPAGSGKTTLICEWLARTTAPVAWLSLDEADNQPLRFLSYLLGAVRGVRPEVGRPPEALLQAMDATELEGLLAALLAIPLGESEEPFALVLDDYQVIDNPVIHQSLAWLLDNLPEGMHLLITTRQDPPLPLARLRVRDELNEIRAAELRFAEAEARVFFNEIMHLELSDAEVQAIGDITHLVPAQLLLARVRLALGDCQGALAALEEAGALAERSGWSDSMGELRGCRALAALHRGELADAERLVGGLALADLDPAPPSLALIEARSRLALARGEAEPLPAALERLIDWYEARDRLGQALELRALRALALAAADREADAAAALEQAVGLARPEGYLRIFIRDRQALAPLLRRLSDPAARTYLAALDTPPWPGRRRQPRPETWPACPWSPSAPGNWKS